MKFAIVAVVVLALTVATQGSVVRLLDGISPISYAAIGGLPIGREAIGGVPLIYSAPFVGGLSQPIFAAREGVYVAKTPGSEHVAPLPGHFNSALSINV